MLSFPRARTPDSRLYEAAPSAAEENRGYIITQDPGSFAQTLRFYHTNGNRPSIPAHHSFVYEKVPLPGAPNVSSSSGNWGVQGGQPAYPPYNAQPASAVSSARGALTDILKYTNEVAPRQGFLPKSMKDALSDIAGYSGVLAGDARSQGKKAHADAYQQEAGTATQLQTEMRYAPQATPDFIARFKDIVANFQETVQEAEAGYPDPEGYVPPISPVPLPPRIDTTYSDYSQNDYSGFQNSSPAVSSSSYEQLGNSPVLFPEDPYTSNAPQYPVESSYDNNLGHLVSGLSLNNPSSLQSANPSYNHPYSSSSASGAGPSYGPPASVYADSSFGGGSTPTDLSSPNAGRLSVYDDASPSENLLSPVAGSSSLGRTPSSASTSSAGGRQRSSSTAFSLDALQPSSRRVVESAVKEIERHQEIVLDPKNDPERREYKKSSGGKGNWHAKEFTKAFDDILKHLTVLKDQAPSLGVTQHVLVSVNSIQKQLKLWGDFDASNFRLYRQAAGLAHSYAVKVSPSSNISGAVGKEVNSAVIREVEKIGAEAQEQYDFYNEPKNDPKKNKGIDYPTDVLKANVVWAIESMEYLSHLASQNGYKQFSADFQRKIVTIQNLHKKIDSNFGKILTKDSANIKKRVKPALRDVFNDAARLQHAFATRIDDPTTDIVTPEEENRIDRIGDLHGVIDHEVSLYTAYPQSYDWRLAKSKSEEFFKIIKELHRTVDPRYGQFRAVLSDVMLKEDSIRIKSQPMVGKDDFLVFNNMGLIEQLLRRLQKAYPHVAAGNDVDVPDITKLLAPVKASQPIDYKKESIQAIIKIFPLAVRGGLMAGGVI
jgi:hypothetical protein